MRTMVNLLEKMVMFFILIFAIEIDMSKAEIYKVGGVIGWTNIGQVNYKTWASTKNFTVGDVIVFQYNKRFHNVVRVSHQDFNACNSDEAYETFTSGNDSFVVKSPGHFYFICSVPGHCEGGQRVDIRVPKEDFTARALSPASADPPTTVLQPCKSHPPEESHDHPPSTATPLPPPASTQTTSDSISSAYSFKSVVILLVYFFHLGVNY